MIYYLNLSFIMLESRNFNNEENSLIRFGEVIKKMNDNIVISKLMMCINPGMADNIESFGDLTKILKSKSIKKNRIFLPRNQIQNKFKAKLKSYLGL
jgi:hypothetical protein